MSLETRDNKLIEIYWHSVYIYWLFQMFKMSSFYTYRLSKSCPNLGIRCPAMSLKASSMRGSNIEYQVTYSTLYAFYTRSFKARYYMHHLLYTKTLRFFRWVNLRVSYDVRLNSDHFPIQYYLTGLRNGNAVYFRRSHRVGWDEYGGSSNPDTYWRPKRCINKALYGKAKCIRWRKFRPLCKGTAANIPARKVIC